MLYPNQHCLPPVLIKCHRIGPRQDNLIIGLLDACVRNLQDQGMRKMFLDSVAEGLDGFKRLGEFLAMALTCFLCSLRIGFVECARYKDVWKDT